MKKVRVIPPKLQENRKLRVAAYCRVSTCEPNQRRSLECQIEYYTKMILQRPDWIFVGIFYDVGKSGLRRRGRCGLDKMLMMAAKGEIDYIIAKSISRVSRDTLDLLKIVIFLQSIRILWGTHVLMGRLLLFLSKRRLSG